VTRQRGYADSDEGTLLTRGCPQAIKLVPGTLLTQRVDSADQTRVVPGTPLTNLIVFSISLQLVRVSRVHLALVECLLGKCSPWEMFTN